MENKKKYSQIVSYRGEWSVKINNKAHIKSVYALTPNAFSEIINNTKLPIILSNEIFTSYRQIRVLVRLKKFEKIFKKNLCDLKFITEAGKESGINYSYMLLSSYFSIYEMIRGHGPWLILINGKWEKIEKLNKACEVLFQKFFLSTYYESQKKNSKQFGVTFIYLINKIIFKYFVKEKSFWITGSSVSKLNNIAEYLLKKNRKFSSLCILNPDKYSLIRSIRSLFNLIMSSQSKTSSIGIVPIKSKPNDYSKEILNSLNMNERITSYNTKKIIINSINQCMTESESYVSYLNKIFERNKPSFIIADQLRWLESTNISLASKKNNVPLYLISHGSHTTGNNMPSKLALERLSDGMLVSNFTSKTVLQSPLAFQAAKNSKKKFEKTFVKPVMWGFNSLREKVGNNKEFTILHAGTYKLLGGRVWIYETSNEFLFGIKSLINAIKNTKKIKLLIRIREESKECDLKAMKTLLPVSNKWEFSFAKTFKEDLERCDILVSYSSTTIEEALNCRKPVAIYGGSSRYRHVSKFNKKNLRTPIYHLTHKNLKKEIIKIKNLYHNSPLSDAELDGYIWNEKIMSKENFLSSLVC